MDLAENSLLQKEVTWKNYDGYKPRLTASIHLFKIKVDAAYQKINPAFILSDQERIKAGRFRQRHDQESYIVSKHFLRIILADFTNLFPADIVYQKSGNNKPSLPGIHFNMSHSKNNVLIAVSETPVGVDIEFIDNNFNFSELLQPCFSAEECSFIINGTNPRLNFYTLWTRKEAYLKGTGEGLTDNLAQVPSLISPVYGHQTAFTLETFRTNDQYLISLASTTLHAHTELVCWDCNISKT